MKRLVILCALLLPAPAMAQSWQAPATPPNDIAQGYAGSAQSFTVIGGQRSAPSGVDAEAARVPNDTQFIINNGDGSVAATVTDAP